MHGALAWNAWLPLLLGQHSGGDPAVKLRGIAGFLGVFYLLLALMNALMALYLWRQKKQGLQAVLVVSVAVVFTILSPLALSGDAEWVPQFPQWAKDATNVLSGNPGAIILTVGTFVLLTLAFWGRSFLARGDVAWVGLNLALFALALSIADANFMDIVTKPDNVPIVALAFLLGFFTWLATNRAVKNDERIAQGLPPLEKLDDEKVLVWPDLVYTELICMVALSAILLFWGLGLQAPLEGPANPVKTPNPSKAPWYFLGLQEMLVYFDPWYAGVVLPSVVLVGLAAIPYMDFNKRGNGYYTIAERKFAYLVFQFGFLVLWVTLILLGTFLRGPNWNLFAPFESWDPHKVLQLKNVDLSYWFWELIVGTGMPKAPSDAGALQQTGYILWREAPGILAVGAYFMVLPPLLATTIFRKFFAKMGFLRYMLMSSLFLMMMTLPLKMILRWTFNLKYIISIPEIFLNF